MVQIYIFAVQEALSLSLDLSFSMLLPNSFKTPHVYLCVFKKIESTRKDFMEKNDKNIYCRIRVDKKLL